jgi:hypothetical protein
VDFPIAFDAALPVKASAVQDWVRLLLMVNRQRERPGGLLQHPLIWDPLLDSLIHGFLLVAHHLYRDALDAHVEPARYHGPRRAGSTDNEVVVGLELGTKLLLILPGALGEIGSTADSFVGTCVHISYHSYVLVQGWVS